MHNQEAILVMGDIPYHASFVMHGIIHVTIETSDTNDKNLIGSILR